MCEDIYRCVCMYVCMYVCICSASYLYIYICVCKVMKKVLIPRYLMCPYPTSKSNRRRLSSSPYSSSRSMRLSAHFSPVFASRCCCFSPYLSLSLSRSLALLLSCSLSLSVSRSLSLSLSPSLSVSVSLSLLYCCPLAQRSLQEGACLEDEYEDCASASKPILRAAPQSRSQRPRVV